jgi:hypothetical protein
MVYQSELRGYFKLSTLFDKKFTPYLWLHKMWARTCQANNPGLIAIVINMFHLPDFLTGENIMCNILKLLQT